MVHKVTLTVRVLARAKVEERVAWAATVRCVRLFDSNLLNSSPRHRCLEHTRNEGTANRLTQHDMVDPTQHTHEAQSVNAAPPARNLRRRRNTSVSSSVADHDSHLHDDDDNIQRDASPQRRATRKRRTSLSSAVALGVKRAGEAIKGSSSSRNAQSEASSSRSSTIDNASSSSSSRRHRKEIGRAHV